MLRRVAVIVRAGLQQERVDCPVCQPRLSFLSWIPPEGSWFISTSQGSTLSQCTSRLFPSLSLSKFDHLDPFPGGPAPGNTIRTLMPMRSTVTLQPSLPPWHTKLSHFLPEIRHFPGWLAVGTFISFREKHYCYPLGVILSPRSQKTATEKSARGTFHNAWAVQSSWLICYAT